MFYFMHVMFKSLINYINRDIKQVIKYKRQGWRLGFISISILSLGTERDHVGEWEGGEEKSH